MSKKIVLLFIICVNYVSAQKTYHFINDEKLDTISNYTLHIYTEGKEEKYLPERDKGIELTKKTIRKADSLVLHFDSWYKESLPKKAFRNTSIKARKQLYIGEVEIDSDKTQTLGTFNKIRKRRFYHALGSGGLVSFPIDTATEIKKFSIYIRRAKYKKSKLIPELFLADSLNDPNKVYLYPHRKVMKFEGKKRKEWLEIPIETYINTNKTKIFAGYVSHSYSDIQFGTSDVEGNSYLDNFDGRLDAYFDDIWTNKRKLSAQKFCGIPVVKIEYEYLD